MFLENSSRWAKILDIDSISSDEIYFTRRQQSRVNSDFTHSMDQAITVAIIGAVGTVVAPIITLFVKEYIEQKPLGAMTERRTALVGDWKGSLRPVGQEDIEIEITFTKKKKKILGTGSFTAADGRSHHL